MPSTRRFRPLLRGTAALLLVFAISTCTDNTGPDSDRAALYVTPTGLTTPNPPQVFVGAGDISSCSSNNDEATAALLDKIPGTVFLVGDNVYPNGTSSEFSNCYQPTWGRHKARTKPVPGNHDYNTSGGSGYFSYFGAAAGTPGEGYYSYNLGQWHIIALNSEISKTASSPQMQWLRADLAAHPNLCTVALWHEPLYSSDAGSGSGGKIWTGVRPLWDTLYAYGADLVLNGHRHNYERIAPMRPNGTSDPTFGIRTMVVGMGGIGGSSLTNVFPLSEARNGNTFGVLKLYLYDDSYAWKFVPVAGKTYTDSGSTACHPRPGSDPAVPTALAFAVQPSNTAAGAVITPAVQVEIRDQFGARMTTASNNVTVAIGTNPAGGTLAGTRTVAAVNGVATFSGLSINTIGAGYTLAASSNGLTSATSGSFNITAAPVPTALGFAVQPSNAVTGAAITPAVQVEVRDQFGARVTTAGNSITLAIGTNPGGGTLSGTHDRGGGQRRRHVQRPRHRPGGDRLHVDREQHGPDRGDLQPVQCHGHAAARNRPHAAHLGRGAHESEHDHYGLHLSGAEHAGDHHAAEPPLHRDDQPHRDGGWDGELGPGGLGGLRHAGAAAPAALDLSGHERHARQWPDHLQVHQPGLQPRVERLAVDGRGDERGERGRGHRADGLDPGRRGERAERGAGPVREPGQRGAGGVRGEQSGGRDHAGRGVQRAERAAGERGHPGRPADRVGGESADRGGELGVPQGRGTRRGAQGARRALTGHKAQATGAPFEHASDARMGLCDQRGGEFTICRANRRRRTCVRCCPP